MFRPFPAQAIVDALKGCQAFTVFERMDDPLSTTGNHLTREIKAAFCDAVTGQNGQEKIDRVPADLPRGRGARQPRRAARRHHRRVPQHDDRRPGLLLRRHRPPAGPDARGRPGPAAEGRVLDARPLGRRVRLASRRTRSSRPSPGTCSARTCRRTRSTARRRRACRRRTT